MVGVGALIRFYLMWNSGEIHPYSSTIILVSIVGLDSDYTKHIS